MSCKHCGLTIRAFSPNKDFCTRDCMEDFLFQEELKQQKVIGQCHQCGEDISASEDYELVEVNLTGKLVKVCSPCYLKAKQKGVA